MTTRPDTIADHVASLRAQLKAQGNKERATQEKRYLKSALEFYGVRVPALRKTAKAFVRAHPELDHAQLMSLARALWQHENHELRAVAVAILELKRQQLSAADLPALIALVRASKTWALVDWIATKVIGPLAADPRARKRIDVWAKDEDFWVRRTALLCHHDALLRAKATSITSRVWPFRCWTTRNSSSAKPSAGCCAPPPSARRSARTRSWKSMRASSRG